MTTDQHHTSDLTALRHRIAELEQNNAMLQAELAQVRETCKQSEVALKQSQELLKFVIQYNPNAIAVFDANLHYMLVSDRYRQDYGLGKEDIIGRHHYDVFPEMPQKWRDVHQRCLAGAIEGSDDDWFLREDGSITYNRWDCRPWYDAQGNIGGLTTFTEVITERKQAEQQLRLAQFTLDRSADGIHWIKSDGRHAYVNDAVCTNLGYTHDELLTMHVADIDPNFPPEAWEPTWNKVKQEGVMSFESEHRRRDGRTFPVEVSTTYLNFNDQEYICAISRDISERKQAEREQRKLAAIIENSNEFIGMITLDEKPLYLNRAGYEMVGLDGPEEFFQAKLIDYIPPEEREWFLREVFPILQTEGHWRGELRFRHFRTGATIPILYNAFLVKDVETGEPLALAAVARDISESKQAEAKLQQLVAVIEKSSDFIGVATLEGEAIYANMAAKQLVGLENDEEFLQTRVIDYFIPEEQERVLQEILPIVMSEGRWQGECWFRNFKTGEPILVEWNVFTIQDGDTGQPNAIACVTRDLTEQKRQEAERAALQEQVIQAQQAALRELSTPLMPIAEGVLAMPLVGAIDSARAQQVLETLLEGVATHQASIAILDITGVQTVDTQVANALIRAAQAVKLLGAQVVLTGIQPQIAQTLVHLGADLRSIVTRGSMQSGIAYALQDRRLSGSRT